MDRGGCLPTSESLLSLVWLGGIKKLLLSDYVGPNVLVSLFANYTLFLSILIICYTKALDETTEAFYFSKYYFVVLYRIGEPAEALID